MYKIYIVEDDDGIATAVAALAKNWGLEAVICGDFHSVTEEFVKVSPHIVILDIGLPFAGGFHWCSEIRKISNVPIIFVSSSAAAFVLFGVFYAVIYKLTAKAYYSIIK